VREPDEYVGPLGHVGGAHLVPLGAVAQRLNELEADRDRDREIITICRSGGRSTITATILMRAGFNGWRDDRLERARLTDQAVKGRGEPMTSYAFIIDQNACIGCHACTIACKSETRFRSVCSAPG